MLYQQSRSAYQNAAASGATQVALLQLVYTRLAQDFLQAAQAIHRADIDARCAASKHALLLLAHLESWLPSMGDPGLVQSLTAFYQMLRASVLREQANLSATQLEACAQLILETRAAWQSKEENLLSKTYTRSLEPPAEDQRMSFQA
jgi:flagellin-specific chaperone FliS